MDDDISWETKDRLSFILGSTLICLKRNEKSVSLWFLWTAYARCSWSETMFQPIQGQYNWHLTNEKLWEACSGGRVTGFTTFHLGDSTCVQTWQVTAANDLLNIESGNQWETMAGCMYGPLLASLQIGTLEMLGLCWDVTYLRPIHLCWDMSQNFCLLVCLIFKLD